MAKKTIWVLSSKEDYCALSTILSCRGYGVVGVQNCEEARKKLFSQEPPSVIICEACLPDGNWKRVFEISQEASRRPLVIVCSLHADELMWSEVLNWGAHDVLVKPFDQNEVVRIVEIATTEKRAKYMTA